MSGAGVQRVVLLPVGATGGAPRRGVVLCAPDDAARSAAAGLGLPVVVCPELDSTTSAAPDRAHRLDALVRGHAVADRWRDLVVIADPDTLRDVAIGLCDLPDASRVAGADGVVTVGLPRGRRPVRVLPTALAAAAVALVTMLFLGRLHPLLLPATVGAVGLALLPWSRTRHLGRTALAAGGLGAALVLLVVAGSARFPVQ